MLGEAGAPDGPILIVEDDPTITDALAYALRREGYPVASAADGGEGLRKFAELSPRLVLLDLMLPVMPGLDVCRSIRSRSDVPILMLTAKDGEADKVVGLEIGADDYITKPFSVQELISRIKAHLRRAWLSRAAAPSAILRLGPVELDADSHAVKVSGADVRLTPKEFELLKMFLESPGRLLTRELLIERVWGFDYFGDTRTLDVHVKRVRSKIELDPYHPRMLKTVRGLGYRLDPE